MINVIVSPDVTLLGESISDEVSFVAKENWLPTAEKTLKPRSWRSNICLLKMNEKATHRNMLFLPYLSRSCFKGVP